MRAPHVSGWKPSAAARDLGDVFRRVGARVDWKPSLLAYGREKKGELEFPPVPTKGGALSGVYANDK